MKYSGFRRDVKRHVLQGNVRSQRVVHAQWRLQRNVTFPVAVVGPAIACSVGVFVLELAVVSSPPYWLEQSRWGGGGKNGRKRLPVKAVKTRNTP